MTVPVGFREQGYGMRAPADFVFGKEAAHERLDAENLEEIADDFDAGGGLRIAAAGEAGIVGSCEGFVAGDVLKSGNGSGRKSSVLTTLKTAILAPMARARIRMETKVKPGSRAKVRKV